jgi:hypothetical protein
VNGLEVGIGVLYLGLGGLIGWLLVPARRAPRGGRHLPAGLARSPGWQRWKVLLPVALALFLANGALWLLRGSTACGDLGRVDNSWAAQAARRRDGGVVSQPAGTLGGAGGTRLGS